MSGLGRKRGSSNNNHGGGGRGPVGTPYDSSHPKPGTRKLEYEDDGVSRMPIDGSMVGVRAAQRMAKMLQSRSGRSSTRLTNTAGMATYVNSLMGSTN